MKRKILTVLLVTIVYTTLAGCGSATPSPASYEEPTETVTYADEVEEEPVVDTEPVISPGLDEVESEDLNEAADVTEEDASWDDEGAEEEVEIEQEAEDVEGIVVLTLYPGPSNCAYVIVDAINPTNATDVQNILSLQIPLVTATNEYGYTIPLDAARFGNFQDQFTSDFSKMAITRVKTSNQSMHAGWLDKDGNFFDVTEAVGEAEASDFEDPVHYQAVGFTDNGATFVYKKVNYYSNMAYETLGYYAVFVDNVTIGSSGEMSPSDTYLHDDDSWSWLGDYRFSDKVDETHFYADNGDKNNSCVLVDIGSQTMTKLIPGETRRNWGAVSSPDGQQIAFMSRPSSGQPDFAELYTMDLTDNITNQITTIGRIEGARTTSFYSEYDGVNILCTTMGWR